MNNNDEGNSKVDQEQQAQEQVFDSSDFFDGLEDSVNGMVSEGGENPINTTEATQSDSGTEQVSHATSQGSNNVDWDSENNPYKKRYKDSSREAVKINEQIKNLKPFVPVLEAMKRDSGLVEHVRDYLQSGGAPAKSIQEKLKLPDDFEYDANEAVTDPNSGSAKLQEAHIDSIVQGRVNQIMAREKKAASGMQQQFAMQKQEEGFKKRHNMSPEKFEQFKKAAAGRRMTLDDAYFILNRDKAAANVAKNTKQDMLKQMKNVRNIPTSASDSNNQGNSQANPDDKLFNGMLGLDNDVDNLFG